MTCPNCGYCSHCGRGAPRLAPYQPYTPWQYTYSPFTWSSPSVTITSTQDPKTVAQMDDFWAKAKDQSSV